MFMLKKDATNVAGKNRIVMTAIVFIAVLSRLLSSAIAAVYFDSFCEMRLYIYVDELEEAPSR